MDCLLTDVDGTGLVSGVTVRVIMVKLTLTQMLITQIMIHQLVMDGDLIT